MSPYNHRNIIIIGAGPAGLSLSSVLMMSGISHHILEKKQTAGGIVSTVQNEFDDFVIGAYSNGLDMQDKIDEFVEKYNPPIDYGCDVINIDKVRKVVIYRQNKIVKEIDYDILILATGVRFNIDARFENSPFRDDIYYRISYRLEEFVNKEVAVIGGGDNATIAAIRLSSIASKVHLINRNSYWKSRKDLIFKINSNVKINILTNTVLKDIKGDKNINSVMLFKKHSKKTENIACDKVVFKIGYVPNTEFVQKTLKLDEKGYIITKYGFETNEPNIYAIGDAVSGTLKRIAVSLGQGVELGNYLVYNIL